MSQWNADAAAPVKKPASIMVFGILNLVFGGFGVIGLGMAVLQLTGVLAPPGLEAFYRDYPLLAWWNSIGLVLGPIITVLLIVAGVGLLQAKSWGRTLSIVYGIYGIAMCLASMVITVMAMLPSFTVDTFANGDPMVVGTIFGGLIGGCGGLIYPILLLIFMTRPAVRAALAPAVA